MSGDATVARLFEATRDGLAGLWESDPPAGTSAEDRAAAVGILEDYASALSSLPDGMDSETVFPAVETVVRRLNAVNEDAGGALVETEEREILATFITAAAKAKGLDPGEYEGGDPTLAVREW